MKYDYLIVGSGLYGTIFAHEAKTHGKTVLVVDKRPNIAGNIYTKKLKESMSINMARIFSIPITKSMELYHAVCRVQPFYQLSCCEL